MLFACLVQEDSSFGSSASEPGEHLVVWWQATHALYKPAGREGKKFLRNAVMGEWMTAWCLLSCDASLEDYEFLVTYCNVQSTAGILF